MYRTTAPIRSALDLRLAIVLASHIAVGPALSGVGNEAGGKQASVIYWFPQLTGSIGGQSGEQSLRVAS